MNKFGILIIAFVLFINGLNSEVSQDNDIFDLEYTIGSNENFEKLTTLNLRKLRESHSSYLAMNQNTPSSLLSSTYSMNIYSSMINPSTKNRLLNELKSSVNPVFRIRLCKKSVCIASTYTNLNNLLASNNINLNLTLHLNSNNNINSITIKNDQLNNKATTLDENDYYLTINANLLTVKPANAPDTQTYVEKVKKEIEAKNENAQDSNKSFLAKYWYYIVPFAVIVFISNFLSPEQGAAEGAR
jgi:hypothetical protein